MSRPDATAVTALQAEVIKPVFFAFLDIDGDPVRCNTSGADITPSGTGDPDLDNDLFSGISADFTDISAVRYAEGGSESVTATLSGITGLDDDVLAAIEDRSNWQGRYARLWRVIRNAANVQQGGFHAYYTGKMVAMEVSGSASEQKITVTIEGYRSDLADPSNRSYLDQESFDPGDLSARAAIAIANGNYGGLAGSAAPAPIYYGPPIPGASNEDLYNLYRWSGGAPL